MQEDELTIFCRRNSRLLGKRISIVDSSGAVLADSAQNRQLPVGFVFSPREEIFVDSFGTGNNLQLVTTSPLQDNINGDNRFLLVFSPQSSFFAGSFFSWLDLPAFLFLLLLTFLLSFFISRKLSLPLNEMSHGVKSVAEGGGGRPVKNYDLPREMFYLAKNVNYMAEQLQDKLSLLIQQRSELETLFASMTDGVLAVSVNHRIIRVNLAAQQMFGLEGKHIRGKFFAGLFRDHFFQDFLTSSLQKDEPIERDVELTLTSKTMSLRLNAAPLYNENNIRLGSLLVIKDLTRLNRLENLRKDFVANVSHELKTPITSIRGYVETLLDGALADDPEMAVKFLHIIEKQANRLENIIEDLLTLARVEDHSALASLGMKDEKIISIIEAALLTCLVPAAQKNITIKTDCATDITCLVNRTMIEQALINLISNAISYSPADSEVIVSACLHDYEHEGKPCPFIVLAVQDNGGGIPMEHQERIFERFYRCDKARSREHGGTGLGLAIVKHVAVVHGGRVEVESQVGKGSIFRIFLPVKK